MTCIAGYLDKKNRRIIMGSDGLTTTGDHILDTSTKKVFRIPTKEGTLLVAGTGSVIGIETAVQSLESLNAKLLRKGLEVALRAHIPQLQEAYTEMKINEESDRPQLLLGKWPCLLGLWQDYTIIPFDSYIALGYAHDVAKQVMRTCEGFGLSGRDTVVQGLEAAIRSSIYVGGKIQIETA